MSDIEVTRPHGRSAAEARRLAETLVENLARQYGVKYRWEGDTLRFDRSGVSGAVHVTPQDLRVQARLGMLLKPFKNRILREVQSTLDGALS